MLKFDRREFLLASGAVAGAAAARTPALSLQVSVVALRTDYLEQPIGVENVAPRLSWRLQSQRRNVAQTAYQILVASDEQLLKVGRGDLWDSGRVESPESCSITYMGRELTSRQKCWWKVRVWDEVGEPSEYSLPSFWEMGLLSAHDWSAQWLAAESPQAQADREMGIRWIWGALTNQPSRRRFRFLFSLSKPSKSGEFFAVSNDWLWSTRVSGIWIDGIACAGDSTRRSSHNWNLQTDNLSAQRLPLGALSAGEHVIGIEVEVNQSLAPVTSAFAFFARVELVNGESLRLTSSHEWKTSTSAEENWYARSFNDKAWEPAREIDLPEFQPWPPLPTMHLRCEFSAKMSVKSARLYITALGAYEARLNGSRIGRSLMTPEISQYAKRVLYQVYDVSKLIQADRNAFGIWVADGWYGSWEGLYSWGSPPRRVLAQLELIYENGARETIVTGPGWRIAESPICRSEIRVGEVVDARLEQKGWDIVGFNDSRWSDAKIGATPSCQLTAHAGPTIEEVQTLKPVTTTNVKPNTRVYDFEQLFAGRCRIKVRGQSGAQVRMTFGELLHPTGLVDDERLDMGEPKFDLYTIRGEPAGEIFEPRFAYRGFRYVQITTPDPTSAVEWIEGIVIHSALHQTGHLRSSDPLIANIWRNSLWAQKSNFVAIPTDCPSREQRGWMGDTGVFWDAAAFNMDICAFSSRHMRNVLDDQSSDGTMPAAAPEPRFNNSMFQRRGGAGWADAAVIIPWIVWQRYGDRAIVENNWDGMNRYIQYILDHNPDFLWRNNRHMDLGDWIAPKDLVPPSPLTPKDLVATAYWAYSSSLLSDMAEGTERSEDAVRLRTLFESIRKAFIEAFVRADGTVGSGSQGSYVLALKFNLIPQEMKTAAANKLANDIRSRGNSLSTGMLGTQFLLDVLADNGFTDLAYSLLLRTDYPSWGYMLRNGATSIWESWRGEKESQNHVILGSVTGFLFRRMAGITATSPGFRTIEIRPALDARVKTAGADYDSVMGRISVNWERRNSGKLRLDLTIPANTTARVFIPATRDRRIQEGSREIGKQKAVKVFYRSDREACIGLGSGTYNFWVS